MPSLTELVRAHTSLSQSDLAWLHLLLADWQIVADLSFADLVLWLPDQEGEGFWAGAQMRPTTGPTAFVDDVVGTFVPVGRRPMLDAALAQGRPIRDGDPEWRDEVPVRVESVPVRREGRILGVLARSTNLIGIRTPSRLELSYLQTAGDLISMISHGLFPDTAQRGDHADSPRVGDGFVRVDATGRVSYASPNALSLYRRLGVQGDLEGQDLVALTRSLLPVDRRTDEETISAVLGGRVSRDAELVADPQGGVALVVRSIPLREAAGADRTTHLGGLILLRDVTDLRRRDQELVTKDATIREIHHRVKNNLQTVAALLRLQARRVESPDARTALEESVRRVASIAMVHETLAVSLDERVDFDGIVDRLLGSLSDVAGAGTRVALRRTGAFGILVADVATPLVMVLTEITQNAIEHGFPGQATGTVTVSARRTNRRVEVVVADDGKGLPPGFTLESSDRLGLQIVRTLVSSELRGTLEVRDRTGAPGTEAVLSVPTRRR